MNEQSHVYIDLNPQEKALLKANLSGLDVLFKAVTFENDIISAFISEIELEKQKSRKTSRVLIDKDISMSVSRLRIYLSDNFSFNPTKQEIYWLICRYLFSKYPGFRDCTLI